MAGRLARGDIRLCAFPSPDKARPVLVLTRSPAIRYLNRVTVAPITTSIRDVPSEVILDETDGMKRTSAVNLHNIVTVRQAALGRRLTGLPVERMRQVCSAIGFALGCDG